MRLPDIAVRLKELSRHHDIPELSVLADHMKRRRSEKAPVTSAPMTDELRDQIRLYKEAKPSLSQAEIGRVFNVNPGRVSEALRGKRR